MERKTALYDCHVACGGKIVPFAGYSLPVQYQTGVIKEHMAVRTKAGLFDVSHMGEVMFEGPDALKNINHILTNDFTNMYDGQVRYSLMCYEDGGVVDDLIVYRYNQEKYLVVVNAANREKDVKWMEEHLIGDVKFEDISDTLSQIALQGPEAKKILEKLTKEEDIPEKYYSFVPKGEVGGIECIVSQTGYTGESGYELYVANADAPKMWNMLLETGKPEGLIPCGLGARDTLRLEAAMPLYGHEMDETIHPLEIGLKFAVKLKKEEFIGKDAIEAKTALTRKRVGLRMIGRGIAREQEKVYADGKEIGWTTSGTHCPYLGYAIAMAILDIDYTELGTKVEVEVRGKRIEAEVVALPFYKKEK
ncbi:glycine cleavage system aminomethyltransferase GcvT [Hespellia stercorisuis]|uniref:Aminomethyltransferase n=1 Tax=Hespellia stercorisuis DSM 15480 TaxID=1121950 RepID=A0A1M6MM50_9FIRM|nr:glycine cleavage system aminomethyltransferase GcvT [Hespellia stercorisuis]SHJ84494.1 aminomethyltransferase [Hespellia stercorisuis DSM 15480]